MRTSPPDRRPRASRTASSRASSSPGSWPGSATLTLAVRQPPAQHDRLRLLGVARRDGDVDRDPSRAPARASRRSAASRAQASQGAAVGSSYSRKGLNSPQPASPSQQHALAHGDAAEAGASAGSRRRAQPRLATSRIASCRIASRSGLPLASSGSSREHAPAGAAPRRAARRGRAARQRDRRRGPRRPPMTSSPHSSSGTPTTSTSRTAGVGGDGRRDGPGRHLDPAADDDVVGPAEHPQPAVVVELAEVVGAEPAVDAARLRCARARPRSRRTAPVRAAAPRPSRRSATSTPSSGTAVVHAAAAGLAHAVGLHHPYAAPLGLRAARRGSSGPPPTSTASTRASASSVGRSVVAQQPHQLGRHQRDVAATVHPVDGSAQSPSWRTGSVPATTQR